MSNDVGPFFAGIAAGILLLGAVLVPPSVLVWCLRALGFPVVFSTGSVSAAFLLLVLLFVLVRLASNHGRSASR